MANQEHSLGGPTPEDLLRSPIGILVHAKALPLYDQERLADAIARFHPFRYPDGTIEFCVPDNAALTHFDSKWLHYSPTFTNWPLTNSCWLRNLVSFPLKTYCLIFRQDYLTRLAKRGVGFGPAGGAFGWYPGERNLSNLSFEMLLHRKPSKIVKLALADRLSSWFRSVERSGLDSEGPLRLAVPAIELRGKRIQLRLDATDTGPRTLLWLLLEALMFGHEVAAVEVITFNGDDELSLQDSIRGTRNMFGAIGRKWTNEDEQKLRLQHYGGPESVKEVLPLTLGSV